MGTQPGSKLLRPKLYLLLLLSCAVSQGSSFSSGKRNNNDPVAVIASWVAAFAAFCVFILCIAYARREYRQMNKIHDDLSAKIREYAQHIGKKYNVTVHETWEGEHIYNHLTREELAAVRESAAQSAPAQDSTYDVLGSRKQTEPEKNLQHGTAVSLGPTGHPNQPQIGPAGQLGESVSGQTDPSSTVTTSASPTAPSSSRNVSQYTMVDLTVKKRKKDSQSALGASGSEVQLVSDFVNDDDDGPEDLPLPPEIPEKVCTDLEET